MAMYTIPRGVRCQIRRVSEAKWRPYVTKAQTSFDRAEDSRARTMIFRLEGWQIRVLVSRIRIHGG